MVEHTVKKVDVDQFIDQLKITWLQKVVIALCFIVAAIDGLDIATIGFIAPAIKETWNLAPTALAPLFLSTLLGIMVGSIFCGPLADKWGRKPILVLSVLLFGITSLISGYSPTLFVLVILRFITGIGLGGCMPCAVAIVSEYCPPRHRSKLVTIMFCGYTLGAAIGGVIAGHLVTHVGWQGILIIGGILPLVVLPLICLYLPESLRFLVLTNAPQEKIEKIVRKLAPDAQEIPQLTASKEAKVKVNVKELFNKKYLLGTTCLWISFAMGAMIIYMVASWMPTILKADGFSVQNASWMTSTFQFGGTLGALIIAYFMDKYGQSRILTISYILGTISVFVVFQGIANVDTFFIIFGIFLVGFAVSGSQSGLFVLASNFYPTNCRVTGISWASAFGRVGSLVGSTIVGWLMVKGMSTAAIVGLLAIPAGVTAIAMIILTKFVFHKQNLSPQLNLNMDTKA